jgi:hypothetical protein
VFESIPVGQNVLLTYDLQVDPNAQGGINPLSYEISLGGSNVATDSVNVSVTPQTDVIVSNVYPSLISPGQPTPLVFTLFNAGNSTIQGINFNWNDPTKSIIPIGSGNEQYLPELLAGQSENLTYQAIADPNAAAGAYTLDVSYSYLNGNTTEANESYVGIVVGGGAQIQTSVQGLSAGQLALTVANAGNNPAIAVSITIPQQQGISVQGPNTNFIGTLNKGDFTVATFTVTGGMGGLGNGTYNGSYGGTGSTPTGGRSGYRGGGGMFNASNAPITASSITVLVTYTDTLGNIQTVSEQVPLEASLLSGQVSGLSFSRGNTGLFGLGNIPYYVGAIIILAGLYWYFKMRKKPVKPAAVVTTK